MPTPDDVLFPGTYPHGLSCSTARHCVAVGTNLTTGLVYVTRALTKG